MTKVSQWLPTGHHWGLHIVRKDMSHLTGKLIASAGDKALWHTTEGSFASAAGKFATGSDIPNVLINPASGLTYQYLPFDYWSKALEHPAGTPETNKAGCRQIEIAGKASESGLWPTLYYEHLGALAVLMEHRTGIPRVSNHPFKVGTRRLTPSGFIRSRGHLGHMHAPNQTLGHWDPGNFRIRSLFTCMAKAEKEYM